MPQQSIYQFILATRDQDGGEVLQLPDEPPRDKNTMRWASGALDGVMATHGNAKASDSRLIASRARKAVRGGGIGYRRLYDALRDSRALEVVDPLLEGLAGTPREPIRTLGLKLAMEGYDREPVKVGIGMIGIAGREQDVAVLDVLGSNDEFTLYAAVAMRNLLADPQHAMWALAQRVHGWGRIELVRRMTDVTDPAIKDWVLHEGYRNQIMYEYLAQVAAEVGGLVESLRNTPVSERTIDAATEIISALIAGEGGPVEGMAAYEDGPEAMRLYIEEMASREATLKEYACVRAIARYLERRSELTDPRWTVEIRQEIGRRAAEVLSRPQWRDMIVAALRSSDLATFDLGLNGARDLGIDVHPVLTRRLRDDPRDGYVWSKLTWGSVTESDIDEVIVLAMELLPLADLATGASDDLGIGLEYRDEGNLGSVVQALKRFPGRGWPLIRVALQNRVRRNRGVAIKALASWTPDQRTENGVDAFIAQCLEAEVVDDLRDNLRALLAFELEPDPPIPGLGGG